MFVFAMCLGVYLRWGAECGGRTVCGGGREKTERARLPRKASAQIHLHIPQFFIQPPLLLFKWEGFS